MCVSILLLTCIESIGFSQIVRDHTVLDLNEEERRSHSKDMVAQVLFLNFLRRSVLMLNGDQTCESRVLLSHPRFLGLVLDFDTD